MTPVLCSSVSSKRSFLGLGLSVLSILTWIAFITAAFTAVIIYSNANRIAYKYDSYYSYNRNNWYYNGNNQNNGGDSADRLGQMYQLLASVSSSSLIFVSIYAACLSMVVTIYGSRRVVGSMKLNGSYTSPRSNNGDNLHNRKHFGFFLGVMAMLANIFLVVAVVFGEFQIGGVEERERRIEEIGIFAVEKLAAVLGSIFISLSFTYFVYSFILFAYKDQLMEETGEQSAQSSFLAPQAVIA